MPQSKKRPKAVAKQRRESSQRPKAVAQWPQETSQRQEPDPPPLTFSLPVLRSPELKRALGPRKDWFLDTTIAAFMDSWVYRPSIPEGWDDSYEGGGTGITPTEDGDFDVISPSFEGTVNEFDRIYSSVHDLLQDIEAIEQWRYPVTGPPPGASHGQSRQGST